MNCESLKEFVEWAAEGVHKSGMFGCSTNYQGRVFALEAITGRFLRLQSQYYVFPGGKLQRRADGILAGFIEAGGSYEILQRDPDCVAIKMEFGSSSFEFRLTWEECQAETFPYQGKEAEIIEAIAKGKHPELKSKYATPRSRMQMMWARLVSDATRAICPIVVAGRYTPEELDFDCAVLKEIAGKPTPTKAELVPPVVSSIVKVEPVVTSSQQIEPKEPEIVPDSQSAATQFASQQCSGEDAAIAREYIQSILSRRGVPQAAIDAALKRRGVDSFSDLSAIDACKWADELRGKFEEKQERTVNVPESSPTDNCSDMQIKRVKSLLEQLAQLGQIQVAERVKNKLHSSGLKLADLSYAEADALIGALEVKNMEEFFASKLVGAAKK